MSPLPKISNLENTSQFKLVKDSNLNRVYDLLIHNTIPVTLYDILLTFREKGKTFEMKRDLLKMITKKTLMLILLVYRIKNYCRFLQRK